MRWRKACWLLITMMIVTFTMSGCNTTETINIGHLAQMESFIGQTSDKALKQYVDEINQNGGINGTKVKLVTYDSRGEAGEAANLVKRLVEKDNVIAIIGPEWSGGVIPLATVTEQLKVPVVGTTATNKAVTINAETGKVNPWLFRVCFIDPYQGFALADFAFNDLNYKTAAILRDVGDPYSTGVSEYFTEQFQKLGGKVLADEGYRQGDVEFRAQLTNIDTTKPDVLLVPTARYAEAAMVGKQIKDLGISIKLMGADAWVSDDLITMAAVELDGSYVSSLTALDEPTFKTYNDAYLKKFGVNPTVYSYMAMDALMLIENLIKTKNVTTREGMREAIENAKDVKVFTVDSFTMDPKTHDPLKRPVVMMTIKDGQWKVHKTYVPK